MSAIFLPTKLLPYPSYWVSIFRIFCYNCPRYNDTVLYRVFMRGINEYWWTQVNMMAVYTNTNSALFSRAILMLQEFCENFMN